MKIRGKSLLPTRLARTSAKDKTASIRFNPWDVRRLKLKPSTEYTFQIKHSDGATVWVAGKTSKALDKCYLSGCGLYAKYEYTWPDIGDTRPIEILELHEIIRVKEET